MATTAEPTPQQIPTLIHLAALTHLEGQIRAAKTIQELQFLSVNETRRLIPYEQAFLLSSSHSVNEACRVLNAASVAVVDRDAPMMVWLEQAVQALFQAANTKEQPTVITEELLPESLRSGWREFVKGHVFWCPLQHPDETVLGAWWFERDFPWQENDVAIVHRLAGSYAYAWKALSKKEQSWAKTIKKPTWWLVPVALIAALCLPDQNFSRGAGQSHGERSGGRERAHRWGDRRRARASKSKRASRHGVISVRRHDATQPIPRGGKAIDCRTRGAQSIDSSGVR